MERLTNEALFCDIAEYPSVLCQEVCFQRIAWERLKSIEDILGPTYDLSRLKELVEADREGRCVMLSGKYVYEIKSVPGDECDGICPVMINGYSVCDLCEKGKESIVETECKQEHIADIGKTVFLTREAAEKALEEQNG